VFFGSLALALALPVGAVFLHLDGAFGARLPFTLLCLVLALLLFWTHRSNLRKHFAARAAVPS
jgi:glycerol-3-phosphate acyltransferase PlsY